MAMFSSLSEKLENAFKKFRSRGKLTEADVKAGMREIKLALLEADVNFKVVKDFVRIVSERAVGTEVMESLMPGQQIVKIVDEELTRLMGGSQSKLEIAPKPPTIVMMVGLQGAGKTTHAGKLAGMYKKQGKRPLLVACDVYRPAAIRQLEVLGEKLDIPVFQMGDREDPVRIAAEGVKLAEQKGYDMVITGERRDEGGMRSVPRKDNTSLCFTETSSGQYRLRPLYYVSDADKAWYKEYYGLRYSDAYEVYGLTRTGCCGCPISYKAIADLELIRPYEPNLVKAAWNIFGKSYEYRQKYNAYKAERMEREKTAKKKAASGE